VRFTTLAALANELQEAQSRRELARVVGRYARTELVVLDLCRHRDYAEGVTCQLSEVPANRWVPSARAGPDIGIVSAPDKTTSS
jgi:hypothetical protein